ncbi:hypothetical protein [Nocardia jejuensis]|uniref:hypothetical protein n=1 Tax=Nocardia jejuensis TaxID=328049 RepID=UPI0012F8CBDB|nr:hypothetical protein [Nocardia jejuensis]
MATRCPWCLDTADDDPDADRLCDLHQAEYDGLSPHQAQRRDAIEYQEQHDITHP